MLNRKTRTMKALEDRLGEPLEDYLVRRISEQGAAATAREVGVSKATMSVWCIRLGITVKRIVSRENQN